MKRKLISLIISLVMAGIFYAKAQTSAISGKVINKTTQEAAVGVTVAVKNGGEKTTTASNGEFRITTSQKFPVTLVFTSVEFEKLETVVNTPEQFISTTLDVAMKQGDVVIVSADRTRKTLINTSVSVEQYGVKDIINSPTDYYSHSLYKKNIDHTTSSFMFKTISTRGFNGSGSTRVNQLVDGMDNQAPGLNFFVGNFIGLTELDVESMELLPGASSALYGPGGMNGTILINSKSPFDYQGLSLQLKQGIMHVDKRQRDKASPFSDYSLRWAKVFNNKFAFKVGLQYISAKDWLANDSSNYQRTGSGGKLIPGNRNTDPNYDGVNVYGDETSRDLRHLNIGNGQVIDLWSMVGQGIKAAAPPISRGIDSAIALSPSILNISRTGYNEKDVIDPETKNIKVSGALHYRFNERLEAQFMGYWATGNTVYTGNNRYVFKGIKMGQYKMELKHKNWFLRGYTTQENAGEAYSATVATQYFNEAWKPSGDWFQQYAQGYLVPAGTIWMQTYGAARNAGQSDAEAAVTANGAISTASMNFHNSGRSTADQGRPLPGSASFKHLFDSVRKVPIPNGGLFLEKSQLWMTEGQYNFTDKIKFADIIVGANWKKYILDSKGTLFIDTAGAIMINEIGAYAQATKKLFNDFLTLSVSGRYDKNEDFKGHFTPRATALIRIVKDNNLRLSYQTAYRFPSTQQKYIRLDVGEYTLLGGLPWINDFMNAKSNPLIDATTGQPFVYNELKPEICRSFEVGYKGMIAKGLMIDAYGYWGQYKDFLGRNVLFQPTTGKVFSTVLNSSTKVKTHGYGIGFDYILKNNYSLFLNAYSDVIADVPTGFQDFFNTPKYRLNAGFGNSGMGKSKRIGFNAVLHWQDEFTWDGELANGEIESFSTVDAQVNYKFTKLKTMIKLGGTNIFNKYYKNAFGNPEIGGLYYISFAFNPAGK